MNRLLLGLAVFSLLIAGCSQTPTPQPSQAPTPTFSGPGSPISPGQSPIPTDTVSPTVSQQPTTTPTATPSPTATVSVQERSMTAQQWHYTPDTITVKKGIPVKLTITSIDVTHGFQLSSGGIDASTTESPGSPGVVEFTPMQTGSFVFRCSVFCGTGHGGMSGTLIVTD